MAAAGETGGSRAIKGPRRTFFQATGGRVRLRPLTYLRWMAVAGPSGTLLLVYFAFGYPLPLL
jgi:hypothetical protein